MKTAQVSWIRGLQFAAESGSKHGIIVDSPTESEDRSVGSSPMELLLISLAGCTAMDVVSILQKKRQSLTSFHVRIEGERTERHPKIYTKIHLKYIVHGRDISEKAVTDAIELSRRTYCSVSAMLGRDAEITYETEIHKG